MLPQLLPPWKGDVPGTHCGSSPMLHKLLLSSPRRCLHRREAPTSAPWGACLCSARRLSSTAVPGESSAEGVREGLPPYCTALLYCLVVPVLPCSVNNRVAESCPNAVCLPPFLPGGPPSMRPSIQSTSLRWGMAWPGTTPGNNPPYCWFVLLFHAPSSPTAASPTCPEWRCWIDGQGRTS